MQMPFCVTALLNVSAVDKKKTALTQQDFSQAFDTLIEVLSSRGFGIHVLLLLGCTHTIKHWQSELREASQSLLTTKYIV